MDRWKAEMERVREKRRAEERRSEKRKSQKKEDADARKGGTVAKHCVFPMICGSGGSKSRLAKAAGAEPSGQMRDEKVHAVVARSTFASEKAKTTPCSEHFWKSRCRKSARRCGAKHISKSTCTKHLTFGPLLGIEMSKKCTPLWREAHFEVKMYKASHVRTTFGSWDVEKVHAVAARSTCQSQKCKWLTGTGHFWRFRCAFAWQAQGIVHPVKCEQTWGFCSISKNDSRRGTCEEDLQRCIFHSMAGAVQETSSSELLGGEGADFLREVVFWSIRYVDFLRWFCVTGAALRMTWHHFFVAGAVVSKGGLEKSQNALVRGCQLCTQLSICEGSLAELLCFWCCQVDKLKKSRRIASFVMSSTSKNEEASQNCFVWDVVKFKKMRKSRRIASFLMWSTSKNKEGLAE